MFVATPDHSNFSAPLEFVFAYFGPLNFPEHLTAAYVPVEAKVVVYPNYGHAIPAVSPKVFGSIFASSSRRMARMGNFYIGISGWRYPGWRGTFYPKGLPQRKELEYASRNLGSIEINGSFYSLQTPQSYRRWYRETPQDFRFSVKAPRYITHIRRLKDVELPVATFFGSGVLLLREKLGAILWQLPPNSKFDPERIETFFRLLPKTNAAARALALRKAERKRLKERLAASIDRVRPLRHAIEVRHDSFQTPGVHPPGETL